MPKGVEVGDIVTIKGEVTHILDEGRIIIVEIRGAAAPRRHPAKRDCDRCET